MFIMIELVMDNCFSIIGDFCDHANHHNLSIRGFYREKRKNEKKRVLGDKSPVGEKRGEKTMTSGR